MARRRGSGAGDGDDARGQLFERVVRDAMATLGWTRARAEAMARTVVAPRRGGAVKRAVARNGIAPFDARRRIFKAAADAPVRNADPSPASAPARPRSKPSQASRIAQLKPPAALRPPPDRVPTRDDGAPRRRGRMFLQGGGPGLGRRR